MSAAERRANATERRVKEPAATDKETPTSPEETKP